MMNNGCNFPNTQKLCRKINKLMGNAIIMDISFLVTERENQMGLSFF